MELRGKTVVITGASSGIGRALAHQLGREGAQLVLTARNKKALECVAREVTPAKTAVIPADLRQPSAIASLCEETLRRFPTVDVLINSAGVGLYAPSYEVPTGLTEELFRLNLFAVVELTRRFVPAIPRGGAVVNISSIAGKVPLPWMTLYSASKYALNAYSDGLRMELARAGIRVLCVCPGYVETPFRENVLIGKIPQKVASQTRFKITADKCAEATLDGLRRGKRTVLTPRIGWGLVILARLFPSALFDRMAKMAPHSRAAASPEESKCTSS